MEALGETGDLSGGGITMDRALRHPLEQDLGRLPEFRRCGRGVLARYSIAGALERGMNVTLDRPIALVAFEFLALPLLGRRMYGNMRHRPSNLTASASPLNILYHGCLPAEKSKIVCSS